MATPTTTQVALLPAPPGYHVDFENPQRRAAIAGYWCTGVGMVLSTAFILMRIYSKAFIAKHFAFEDVCICISFVFSYAVQALLLHLWRTKASGVHAWEMPIDRYNDFSILIMTASVLYVPCLGMAKFSLLLFYHRLSNLRWLKTMSIIMMIVVLGYSFAIIFALIFPCNPIAKNWDVSITTGTCINRSAIYIATAAVNVATDLSLLLLPIPVVLKLQVPNFQKAGLIFIFTLGSLTCVTSIIRLVVIVPMLTNMDQTWAVSVPCVWINVEANLVIICASLPALRVFFRHFAPRLVGEVSGGGSGKRHDYSYSDSNPSPFPSKLQQSAHSQYSKMDPDEEAVEFSTLPLKGRADAVEFSTYPIQTIGQGRNDMIRQPSRNEVNNYSYPPNRRDKNGSNIMQTNTTTVEWE